MSIHDAAHAAYEAGCAVIPIAENKKASVRWAEYQQRRPSLQRLNHWLRNQPAGIAVLGGTISGNLEILDFDDPAAWTQFATNPPDHITELLDRIRHGYEEQTPKGGRHLIYRIDGKPVPGNTKLAADTDGQVRIETRGEGGYAVVAPSGGTAHPSGQPWTLHHGSFADIVTITADEHDELMAYCATFHTAGEQPHTPSAPRPDEDRPGDRWNHTCTIDQYANLLTTDGWHILPHIAGTDRRQLVRPGKDPSDGESANLRTDPTDGIAKLFVHSTSAPIPANTKGQAYTPFGYLVATRHGTNGAIAWLRTHGHLDTPTPWNPFKEDPNTRTANPLEVRTIAEALADTTPAPPELVAGLIRSGESTIIGAPRGIGKSFLGMQLALMLAAGTGNLFDRHRILRTSQVLYCHGELDPYSARSRWRRMLTSPTWAHIANPTPPPGLSETFTPWRIDLRKTRTTHTTNGITTTTETAIATLDPRLEARISKHKVEVLILDPWASYHGGSENNNDDTEAVLAELRRISLTYNTTVIIIAHFGKNTDTRDPEDLWRGASRLPDWASNRITLTEHYTKRQRAELELTRKQARRYLNVTYLRRGAPVDDHSIRRDDDGYWHDWTPDPGGRPAEHQVSDLLQALADHGGTFTSQRQAADALGVSRNVIARLLDEAGSTIEIVNGPNRTQTIRIANYAPNDQNAPGGLPVVHDRWSQTPPTTQTPRSDPESGGLKPPVVHNPPTTPLTSTSEWSKTPFPPGTDTPPPERRGAQSPEPNHTSPEPEGGTIL